MPPKAEPRVKKEEPLSSIKICSACNNVVKSTAGTAGGSKFASNRQTPLTPKLNDFEIDLLFNRLDQNSDLLLSRDEFKHGIHDKLKMQIDWKELDRVFDKYDGNGDKYLQVTEFKYAYNELYEYQLHNQSHSVTDADMHLNKDFIIKASRYGRLKTKEENSAMSTATSELGVKESEMIFECYIISLKHKKCDICKQLPKIDGKDGIKNASEGEKYQIHRKDSGSSQNPANSDVHFSKIIKSAKKTQWKPQLGNKSLQEELMKMIEADSKTNKEDKTDIKWWVDVSCRDINSIKSNLVDWFKLPKDEPKILSTFSNFGTMLSENVDDRIFIRNTVKKSKDKRDSSEEIIIASSLTMFIQWSHAKKTPILTLPFFTGFGSYILNAMSDYLCIRFPFVLELFTSSAKENKKKSELYAYASALVYERIFENDKDIMDIFKSKKDTKQQEKATWKKMTSCEPAPFQDYHATSPGSKKVISSSAAYIRSNRPQVGCETLGLHLLDFGYGCNCLLTIRQIDDEKSDDELNTEQIFSDLEPKSRQGVYGRLFYCLWLKIVELSVQLGGESSVLGELDDCPMALAGTIMCLVHDFARHNSVVPLNFWIDVLETEISDIIVSKHFTHCIALEKELKELILYVDPWEEFWTKIMSEALMEESIIAECIIQAQKAVERETLRSRSRRGSIIRRGSISNIEEFEGGCLDGGRGGGGCESQPKNNVATDAHNDGVFYPDSSSPVIEGLDGIICKIAEEKVFLPDNVSKVELKLNLMKKFFGKDSFKEISKIKDGYSKHELKGISSWHSNVHTLTLRTKNLFETMKGLRDEKRRFTSFLLTIITVLMAPLTILTGYWGMNFDNMVELTDSTYPTLPGVKIMWATALAIYGVFIVFAIHFRVIYSAS